MNVKTGDRLNLGEIVDRMTLSPSFSTVFFPYDSDLYPLKNKAENK